MDNLEIQLRVLADLREDVAQLTATMAQARADARAKVDRDYCLVLDRLSSRKEALEGLDAEIRTEAISNYNTTKDKQVAPGLGIRVMHDYEFEEKVARQWAILENPTCLSLNKRAFTDVCKSDHLRPAFVTVEEVVTATIAPDLRRFYPEEDNGVGRKWSFIPTYEGTDSSPEDTVIALHDYEAHEAGAEDYKASVPG